MMFCVEIEKPKLRGGRGVVEKEKERKFLPYCR
jgi:hypothetical protein